jgi:DNA polymerase-3 subunit alpha
MESIPQYLAARSDPRKVHYDHPLLEPILRETFGCIVYQEQVMEICRALAGYSYGRADLVRRAMAKKKHDVMAQEREVFLYGNESCPGAIANGVPEETANAIFDRMTAFASYAFNKSHAAAYARVAYETAYLKCRYPHEYFAALMTSVMGYTAKLLEYIALAEANGITVLPPSVNRSGEGFTASDNGIRFGLLAIKGMGSGAIRTLLHEREENGAFRSLQDFCDRCIGNEINKRCVESMIRAGAFDGLGWNRRQMLSVYEPIMNAAGSRQRTLISGQLSLFGNDTKTEAPAMQPPAVPEYPEQILLQMEKEVTGLFLSGHPLSRWRAHRALLRLPEITDLPQMRNGTQVMLLCMVAAVRPHLTKKSDKMCYLTVEDFTGSVELPVFPSLYPSVEKLLVPDAVIWIKGKISRKDGEARLLCDGILSEQNFADYLADKRLCCKLPDRETETAKAILALCARFPGDTPCCFWLMQSKKYLIPRTETGVQINSTFYKCLTELLPASQCALIDRQSQNRR